MSVNLEANGETVKARRYLVVANNTVVIAMSKNYWTAYTEYSKARFRYKQVSFAVVAYDFYNDGMEE